MSSCDVIVLLLFSLAIAVQAKPLVVEKCGPGEYRYVDPQLTECRDCPQHTYSSTTDEADHCASCSQRCFDKRNAVVLHGCNSTHDLSCQCIDGYYASSERTICKRHTTCPENCLKHPGSASTNTVCYDPCPTTTSENELSMWQSSTGSTAVVMNDQSTASPPNLSSSLMYLTTSSSNQTASDNFLQILLPVVIPVLIVILVIIVFVCCWEKICRCLNLKRNYREHVYECVNGGDQHPAVNHHNASLGTGNDRDGMHRQFKGSDLRPASPSLEREVPSDGDVDMSFQVLPPHDDPILPEVLPNEALVPVPSNQALPLPSGTAGGASSEETAALLPELRPDGSSSRPLSHREDLLPEDDYAQARLLSGLTDIQDSLIEHNSVDPSADTSNSDDLGASTSNTEDIRGSRTMLGLDEHRSLSSLPGTQDNRRTSARPCARVPPLLIPQPNRNLQADNSQHAPLHPNLYLQANNPQHAPLHPNLYLQANDPQHAPFHPQPPLMIHPQQYQPNNPPDVPNQIVDVESVDSLSQGNEFT